MKASALCLLLLLLGPAIAHADDSISYQILNSEFKGGIIVYEVEVYENPLTESLPSENELLWVANRLVGNRGSDPRRKLVQFVLPGMTSGLYALAQMEDGPIEVKRQPWSLADSPQYGKYVDENFEFIKR